MKTELLIFALVWALTPATASASGLPGSQAQSVRDEILRETSNIRAFYIEYQGAAEPSPEIRPGAYVHRLVAAKFPEKFFGGGAHGTDRYSWKDDPFSQQVFIDGTLATVEHPFPRTFVNFPLTMNSELPGTAMHEILFRAVGWWPFQSRPSPKLCEGAPASLAEACQLSAYHIGEQREVVDGDSCYVLENVGRDRIWIDPQRGCAILAREISDPLIGRVTQKLLMRNFRELEPGTWCPMEIDNLVFDTSPSATGTTPIHNGRLVVLDARVNEQVDDAIFRFKPAPAAIEVFPDQHFQQIVPGGSDYLDYLRHSVQQMQPGLDRHPSYVVAGVEYSTSLLLVLLAVLRLTRALRCRTVFSPPGDSPNLWR